jgi:hypothetical protein
VVTLTRQQARRSPRSATTPRSWSDRATRKSGRRVPGEARELQAPQAEVHVAPRSPSETKGSGGKARSSGISEQGGPPMGWWLPPSTGCVELAGLRVQGRRDRVVHRREPLRQLALRSVAHCRLLSWLNAPRSSCRPQGHAAALLLLTVHKLLTGPHAASCGSSCH